MPATDPHPGTAPAAMIGPAPLSLPLSLHFWSAREELLIRETDFGTFRFHDKSESRWISDRPYAQDKISFAACRAHASPFLDGGQKALRSALREMEIALAEAPVVFSEWRHSGLFQLLLASGVLVSVFLARVGVDRAVVADVSETVAVGVGNVR